jgi:hypothetical protein
LSEDRTPSGQFAEPAYGQAGIEREAGYTPMPDTRKKDEDKSELTIEEAAERRAEKYQPPVPREYVDEDGNPAPRTETLTIERAADDLSAMRKSEAADAISDDDAALLAELGVELDDKAAETDDDTAELASIAESRRTDGDLDAELETALNHPHIREALQKQVAENETARQQYQNGIDAAAQIAQAAFMQSFPEFANATPDQYPNIVAAIAAQNPGRLSQMHAAVVNSSRLFEAQRVESQRAAERQAAEFKTYAAEQDALFDTAAKDIPPAQQQRAFNEVVAAAKEFGIQPADFTRMMATDRVLKSAPVQRMMLEAGLYRAMMKSSKTTVSKDIPPVQRPGARQPSAGFDSQRVSNLKAQFDRDPSLKNAAALRTARRAASNRG